MVALVDRMKARGFTLLDVQFMTDHLRRFGAVEIPRDQYEEMLHLAIKRHCQFDDESESPSHGIEDDAQDHG